MSRRRISRKVWWLDILIPLVLSGAILAGFIGLIYSGQRHRRIASKIEERLIGVSLRTAGAAPAQDTKWLTVLSLQESDAREFAITHVKGIRDISISDYSKVLARILSSNPQTVFFSWVPAAHGESESYEPLNSVLRMAGSTKVVFAVRYDQSSYIPAETRKLLTIVDSDGCIGSVQNICTFDRTWTDWMPQFLANLFMKNLAEAERIGFISENLPRSEPSYLIYLQDLGSFDQFDFSSVSKPDQAPNFSGKTVFVGNGLYQNEKSGQGSRREVNRVLTHISPVVADSRISGVPLHSFWAQLAQMFRSERNIRVLSENLCWLLAGFAAAAILMIFWEFGVTLTLGLFLFFVVSAPYANAGLIKYFGLYVPIFDVIFGGISSLLIATFGKLSVNAYRRWAGVMRKLQEEQSRDLKGNFLSLISHNLNTPVAKMQGMLDLLEEHTTDQSGVIVAQAAGQLVAQIQLCIRAVLAGNSLKEGNLNNVPMTIAAIRDEFKNQMQNCLLRLKVYPAVSFGATDPDLQMLPLAFDKKVLVTALASLCALYQSSSDERLSLSLEVDEGMLEGRVTERLICRIIGRKMVDFDQVAAMLTTEGAIAASLQLLTDVSIKVLIRAAKAYNGLINATVREESIIIELVLYPA